MLHVKLNSLLFIAFTAVGLVASAHPSADLHHKDIDIFLGGFKGTDLGDVAYEVSDSIDNELAAWFRQKYGKIPGNHRLLSHGYTLGEDIPKEVLDKIAKEYGDDVVRDVIKEQQKIAGKYLKKIMDVTGLPRKQARALLRQFSNSHLLGDLMKDNTLTSLVKDFDAICDSEIRVIDDLFGRTNPEYAKKLIKEIKALKKSGLSVAEKAELLTQLFGKFKVDAALNKAYGNVFKKLAKPLIYNIDQAINRNAKLMKRMEGFAKKSFDFVKCNYREAKIGGRIVKVVDVPVVTRGGVMEAAETVARRSPVEAAAVRAAFAAPRRPLIKSGAKVLVKAGTKVAVKEGVSNAVKDAADAAKESDVAKFLKSPKGEGLVAGIVTFVIDQGIAVVEYSEGDLAQDQFVQKTVFNTAKAGVMGGATMGIASAASSAGLPIWAVFTAQFAVCIVIEKVGEYIWAEVEKECGVLPGVTEDELLYTLPSCVRNRHVWVENLDEEKMKKRRSNNKNIFEDGAPTDFEQTGQSFY